MIEQAAASWTELSKEGRMRDQESNDADERLLGVRISSQAAKLSSWIMLDDGVKMT